MKSVVAVAVALAFILSLSGCSGSGSGGNQNQNAAAIWKQWNEAIVYDLEWDFDEEADLEHVHNFFDGIFGYYTEEFSIKHTLVQDVIEVTPASFGDSYYRTRTLSQSQIYSALDVAEEHGWSAVNNLDALDLTLLQQLLFVHTRDEADWLEYLDDAASDPDFFPTVGYPKAEEPVLSVQGQTAELVFEWIIRGLLTYEGDSLPLSQSVQASVLWQQIDGVWLIQGLSVSETTSFQVPRGYWVP